MRRVAKLSQLLAVVAVVAAAGGCTTGVWGIARKSQHSGNNVETVAALETVTNGESPAATPTQHQVLEPSQLEPSAKQPSQIQPVAYREAAAFQTEAEEVPARGASSEAEPASAENKQAAIEAPSKPSTVAMNADVWTLEMVEALALENNPAILQAAAAARKAMGYRNQVAQRFNPIVGYNGTQLADRSTDQHTAFIQQDWIRGDKLARGRAVLSWEVQAKLWEMQAQKQRVLTDVRQAFYEALAAQRRAELASQFKTISLQAVQIALERQKAKEGSAAETLQSEIQLEQTELQEEQAGMAYAGAWRKLAVLAGMADAAPCILQGSLALPTATRDWNALAEEIIACSPELHAARAKVARAQENLRRQQAQAAANLTWSVAGGYDNGTQSGIVNTQVGVPLSVNNRNEGNIAAARAELNRACWNVRRLESLLKSKVAAAAQQYEIAAAAVVKYEEEILPRVNKTMTLADEAFAAGEFGFLEALLARKSYFESSMAHASAQADLAQALCLIDGLVLSGGFSEPADVEFDASLREQALNTR